MQEGDCYTVFSRLTLLNIDKPPAVWSKTS